MPLSVSNPDVTKAADKIVSAIENFSHLLERLVARMEKSIEDFAAVVNEKFDKIGVATQGLAGDVSGLKDEIAKLQAAAGSISPEGQALLDGIASRASDLSDRLSALDDLTTQAPTP